MQHLLLCRVRLWHRRIYDFKIILLEEAQHHDPSLPNPSGPSSRSSFSPTVPGQHPLRCEGAVKPSIKACRKEVSFQPLPEKGPRLCKYQVPGTISMSPHSRCYSMLTSGYVFKNQSAKGILHNPFALHWFLEVSYNVRLQFWMAFSTYIALFQPSWHTSGPPKTQILTPGACKCGNQQFHRKLDWVEGHGLNHRISYHSSKRWGGKKYRICSNIMVLQLTWVSKTKCWKKKHFPKRIYSLHFPGCAWLHGFPFGPLPRRCQSLAWADDTFCTPSEPPPDLPNWSLMFVINTIYYIASISQSCGCYYHYCCFLCPQILRKPSSIHPFPSIRSDSPHLPTPVRLRWRRSGRWTSSLQGSKHVALRYPQKHLAALASQRHP